MRRWIIALLAVVSATVVPASADHSFGCSGFAPVEPGCVQTIKLPHDVHGLSAAVPTGVLHALIVDQDGNMQRVACVVVVLVGTCTFSLATYAAGEEIAMHVQVIGVGDWSIQLLYDHF